MLKLTGDPEYSQLKALALDVYRGYHPGTYLGDGQKVIITRLSDHYQLKAELGFCSFTFFYPLNQFEVYETVN